MVAKLVFDCIEYCIFETVSKETTSFAVKTI